MYIQNLWKHNWEKQIEKVKKDWNIELKKNGFELERAIQYNGFAFKNDDVLYHLKWFNSLKFIPHFKFLKQSQNGDEKKKDLLVSSLFYALSLKNYFIEADVNIGENLSVDNV